MRIIARLQKGHELRFISHLDLQRLMQRAFHRAGIPLEYSLGFNPHPLLSFATALSVGFTSDAEWMDVRVRDDYDTAAFMDSVNAALPKGARILEARVAQPDMPALTTLMQSAQYTITLSFTPRPGNEEISSCIDGLKGGEIIVEKRTKGGIKPVDIRPALKDINIEEFKDTGAVVIRLMGVLNTSGGLPVELLMKALAARLGVEGAWVVHRLCIHFEQEV